ncbi:MAG: putative sugar nucleotidyl transferase [candidate division Zixibacteria bacterium]
MRTIFYEDNSYANFYPVSFSRPVYTLLLGTSRIYKKWLEALKIADYSFFSREYLAEITALDAGGDVGVIPDDDLLFINGRYLPSPELVSAIKKLDTGEVLESGDGAIAFRIGSDRSTELFEAIESLKNDLSDDKLLSLCKSKRVAEKPLGYIWDLINLNGEIIDREFTDGKGNPSVTDSISKKAELIKPKKIHLGQNVAIGPMVVIDASQGAVVIDNDVIIEPFTYIQGPAYIGPGSRLVGGRIREGCSIGPVCRVGGETEETIMQGFCNKYHEGFLGHAYLGEWVNLGALTTNSDLKNNYGDIKVQPDDKLIDTRSMKVGCFIGDHTKTGIGTMLNTGISIGFSCNLYGGALFTEKRIKSFGWGTPGEIVAYRLEKAVETASASMSRRGMEFNEIHQRLFANIEKIDRYN